MKKPLQFVLLLVIVAFVAAAACLLTRHFVPPIRSACPEDSHAWIHQQLGITFEQAKSLEPIEHRYSERRMQLAKAIEMANEELANAILEDKSASPRVNAAIEKIHAAQGELQMVTIAHVFEMKAVLTPEQWEKLMKLTAQALKSQTGDNH
jgi:Spy/CpxP family protein refolding chaperone